MTKTGLTVAQAVEQELYSLGEAIGNCLELTDDFLDRYCGKDVVALLRPVAYESREFVLEGNIGEGRETGYESLSDDTILLPVGEIEVQIESVDDLDDPDDWTISGDCAYAIMIGAAFVIDLDGLKDAIEAL